MIILALIAGIWWYNNFTIKITYATVSDEKINQEITIVQLTDLHGMSFGKDNRRLIDKIKNINPDFIVITGDMYSAGSEKGRDNAIRLMSELAKDFRVYFVNGEHDISESYFSELEEAGVVYLNYAYDDIYINDNSIRVYGITNSYYSGTFDLSNAFSLDESKYNILLAHIENFNAFSDFGIDLSICGDTHGGIIRLPFVGGVNNRGVWFPEVSNTDALYVKGLYELDDSKLFVSSGLGNYPLPIRLFNRPEIAVIKLVSE